MARSNSPSQGRSRALIGTLAWGAASLLLYIVLFALSDRLVELAAATRQGEKIYALVPIVIAVVFSLVHGAFTSHFWDLLGLKAKQ